MLFKKGNHSHTLKVLFVYLLLSYSFLYFAYKYFIPDIACVDFFNYYPLYKYLAVRSVVSPFNTRLLNAVLVFIFNNAGIHYNTNICFQNPAIDQSVFFCALLVSYLAVVFTSLVVYLTCYNYFKNKIFSFFIGLLYLLGGGTLVFCINPATDAVSILLFALTFKLYAENSKWVYLVLILAIFQREYLFLVISLIAILDFWFDKRSAKKHIPLIIASVFCFGMYIVLRNTILYTHNHLEQFEYESFLSRIFAPKIDFSEYIRQGVFCQNILIGYWVLIIYKRIKKYPLFKKNIWITLALCFQINLICLMALLGNNIGRIFYMATPIFLFYLAVELFPIYESHVLLKKRE